VYLWVLVYWFVKKPANWSVFELVCLFELQMESVFELQAESVFELQMWLV